MPAAIAAIATAKTDAAIAQQERAKGAEAARAGKRRGECPWSGGLCERWWLEGYDNPLSAWTAETQ